MTNGTLVLGLRGPVFGKTGLTWCERGSKLAEGRERGLLSQTVLGSLQLSREQSQQRMNASSCCRIHCLGDLGSVIKASIALPYKTGILPKHISDNIGVTCSDVWKCVLALVLTSRCEWLYFNCLQTSLLHWTTAISHLGPPEVIPSSSLWSIPSISRTVEQGETSALCGSVYSIWRSWALEKTAPSVCYSKMNIYRKHVRA